MSSDWLYDQLYDLERKAEQIPVPALRDAALNAVRTLRWVYGIWRLPPVNSAPIKLHAEILGDLYQQHQALMAEYNEHIVRLQQSWGGPAAELYLGINPSAFQIEHDLEPSNTSASMLFWANMNMTQAGLDYNAAAHRQSGTYLDRMNDLHNQLDWNFKLALGDLAIMIGSAVIPGVDLVDAGPTEGIEAYEVGKAAKVAEEIAQAERDLKLEQEIDRVAAQAWRMYDVWRLVQMGGAILIAGAGLTVVVILAERKLVPVSGQPGTLPSNAVASPTPIPIIQYPPSVAGDSYREAMYAFLFLTQGAGAANQFASTGIWPADEGAIEVRLRRIVAKWPSAPPVDIALLLQLNCTDAQIERFLQRVADAQKNGQDAYRLTADQLQALLQQVIDKLKSKKSADQSEGQVALLAIAGLTGVEINTDAPSLDPTRGAMIHSRYDVVTAHAIIEVTTGDGSNKTKQLKEMMVTDAGNYAPPKPLILYDPTPLPGGLPNQTIPNIFNQAQQMNQRLGTHIEVFVITPNGEWHLNAEGTWQKMQNANNSSNEAENLLSQLLHDLGDIP